MKPIKFPGCNVEFGKDQKEYLPLPSHRANDGCVTTCWKLSLKERLIVLLSGKVFIQILTFNQALQPMLPLVNNPIEIPTGRKGF